MDPLPPQSVAIDGLNVRRIREEKRLTQLYVAKVVGVTTDTVSRWENNRYPTIRRDNALNLAEALEVDLDDILKQEEVTASDEGLLVNKKRIKPNIILGGVFLGLLLLAITFFIVLSRAPSAGLLQAKRIVPVHAADGSRVLIQVEIASEKPLKGMILKEKFPLGWRMIESEPGASSVDARSQGARWIFRNPPQTLKIYYMLEVKQTDLGTDQPQIIGEVIANPDGQHSTVSLENVGRLQIKPLHWADTNGNFIIDDLEILEVSEITEGTGDLKLEWDLIEKLWESGGYRWMPELKEFVPTASAPDE